MVQFTTRSVIFVYCILILSFWCFKSSNAQSCDLLIMGNHYSMHQLNESHFPFKAPVRVFSPCNAPVQIISTDKRYLLADKAHHLSNHYFNWNNWRLIKEKGDGGVDVTGAPISQLVEGANFVKLRIAGSSLLRFSTQVPTEGYIMFDWDHIGGSTTTQMKFLVNNKVVSERKHFTSKFLKPGDRIDIVLENKGSQGELVEISNFRFLSNALEVIVRKWKALDIMGNQSRFDQYIGIEKMSINAVVFPSDFNHVGTLPNLASNVAIKPNMTGLPYLDEDGNMQTEYDQIQLSEECLGFQVQWQDEIKYVNGGVEVVRRWKVFDTYSNNTITQNQIIRLGDAFTEKGISEKNAPMEQNDEVSPEKGVGVIEISTGKGLVDKQ